VASERAIIVCPEGERLPPVVPQREGAELIGIALHDIWSASSDTGLHHPIHNTDNGKSLGCVQHSIRDPGVTTDLADTVEHAHDRQGKLGPAKLVTQLGEGSEHLPVFENFRLTGLIHEKRSDCGFVNYIVIRGSGAVVKDWGERGPGVTGAPLAVARA
jgi:hypothetical protein